MTGDDWPTIRPVDGSALVAAVNAATGAGLVHAGRLPGGNAGATAARDGDRELVVTAWQPAAVAGWATTGPLLDRLRAAGYPAPALRLVPLPGGGAATVQGRVAGVPPTRPTPGLVADLVRLVELQAGLATEAATSDLHLDADGPGFCLHEPLRRRSAATRELLDWIEELGPAALAGRDLVHFDLHLDNVLVARDDPDRVAGIVDWAGARVGDRAFDLVTVGFDLTRRGQDPGPALDRLGRPPAEYVAHVALRFVDWAIRHRGPADVDAWLAVARHWRALAA